MNSYNTAKSIETPKSFYLLLQAYHKHVLSCFLLQPLSGCGSFSENMPLDCRDSCDGLLHHNGQDKLDSFAGKVCDENSEIPRQNSTSGTVCIPYVDTCDHPEDVCH